MIKISSAKNNMINILALEEDVFGYNHCHVGKIILEKWNFPNEYIDTIFQHHTDHIDSPFKKTIEIVSLANIYAKILNEELLLKDEEQLKETFMPDLSITEELDENIINNFMKDIEDDELFVMTRNL